MVRHFVYISCWKEHGGAPGIALLGFEPETGALEQLGALEPELSCGCTALDRERGILYITNELHEHPDYIKGGGGLVWAFRIDPGTGELTRLSRAESCCPCPAYLCLDSEKKYLLCANHSSFNAVTRAVRGEDGYFHPEVIYDDAFVGLFRLNDDGSIGPLVDISLHNKYKVEGRGLHSRPHTVVPSPDGRLYACCDKGDAHIYMYRLADGRLELACEPYADIPGSAPRYCAFHPERPWFYTNHERDLRVCAYSYAPDGSLTPIGEAEALPEGVARESAAARAQLRGVAPEPAEGRPNPLEQQGFVMSRDGRYLYDMVNGADAVSVLRIGPDGAPELIQTLPIEGRWVRGGALSPDGRSLLVTCLQSGDVYSLPVLPDGRLGAPVSGAKAPGASYVTFV